MSDSSGQSSSCQSSGRPAGIPQCADIPQCAEDIARRTQRRERGQASVELIAALPIIALLALAVWQLAVAGHGWWRLAEAARVAAREVHVGRQRGDERAAERRATGMVRAISLTARLSVGPDGAVRLDDRVPLVGPFALVGAGPRLTAASRFGQ